jgi:plastocyanin
MSDATVFYILGGILAAMAVATSFVGLRFKSFPGRYGPLLLLCFVLVAGAAITFAIRNGQHEETARAAETGPAGEEIEEIEESPVPGEAGSKEGSGGGGEAGSKEGSGRGGEAKATGPGGTLALAASPTDLAFDKKQLTSKPGKVTIDFDNPAPLEHNVAIEQGGNAIAQSETLAEGKTTVSAELAAGTYTFLCTIPGHAEAGMEGTLTVR